MDQVFCMRMFTRVVELESFIRASEEFDVARSTATQAVAQLEKRLGVRLLHRTTRQLTPTEDGRAYYESCVRILSDLAEAEDALSSARSRPRGKLRVTTPYGFVRLIFIPQIHKFLARYPELELEVVMSDKAVNLVEEGIDCAVRGTPIADDSLLVARHIATVRWMTCASPEYLRKHGTPKRIEDLAKHNCIRFVSPSTRRASDWQFETQGELTTFTPRGNLAVNGFEAAGAAASYGVGIAQVPEPLVSPAIREKRLKPVLLAHIAPAPSLQVVYPSNRYLSAKVRAFADFVAELFPKEVFR
jgi:LysR family transcriptional regulator, regulator for bpeEF and oprC